MRCWHGICLERSANDLHMVQLILLPPHHPCSSKIQNGLSFWYRPTQVVLEIRPLNDCVCVCVCDIQNFPWPWPPVTFPYFSINKSIPWLSLTFPDFPGQWEPWTKIWTTTQVFWIVIWNRFLMAVFTLPTCSCSCWHKLEKNARQRGRTDCRSVTHDLDLQSPASYGHDLLKSSRSTVSWFQRQSGKKGMDGQTEKGDCITLCGQ